MKNNSNQYNLFGGDYILQGVECRLTLKASESLYSTEPVSDTRTARNLLRDELMTMANEHFVVLNLDALHRPINYIITGCGGTGECPVTLQSVFKAAILSSASAIIVMHNHPSSDCYPSKEDKTLTEKIKELGVTLGYPLLDHIIVSSDGDTFSFADAGLM